MITHGKGRAPGARKPRSLAPSLLLTLLLSCALVLGLGAAAPVLALTLGGTVANDANGNGILDAADTPLAGIQVSVQPAGGGVSATTTTAADGTYSFPGLAVNNYTVTVADVPGLNHSTPASVTVPLGADRNDVNFLFVTPGLISGMVISDLNSNGIAEPGEPGIADVQVELRRVEPNGTVTPITTVTTGPDGTFFFPIQPPGTYLVVETDPPGVVSTGANAGTSGTGTVVDANTIRVVMGEGQTAVALRFADRTPSATGISGFVYDDTNNNNTIDPPADQPVANVVVELRDAAQNLLARTLTGADGQYFFGSVVSGGTYVVRIIPPPGTALRQVSPTAPATAAGTTGILIRGLNPSTNYANNNFLLGPTAVVSPEVPGAANAISGRVFNDLNGDGVVSAGEPGLAGATLTLVSTTGVSFGTTTTGASGDFTFVNLPAGEYILTRTNPAGFVSTGAQPGVGGLRLNVDTIRITVTGNNNLFGGHIFLARATAPAPVGGVISGSVIRDTNFNNVIDPADLPLAGVRVLIQSQFGGFLGQAFTDVSGAYAFTGLQAGTYRVVEVDPANVISIAAVPGPGGFAIDANTLQVTLPANGVSGNNNFLDRATAVQPTVGTISGSVLRDTNGNGVIDGGDQPAPGVTVRLFTGLGVFVGQTVTDGNGAYAFPNLPPGTYLVQELDPPNVVSVAAFAGPGGLVVNPNTIQVNLGLGQLSGNNNFLDQGQAQLSTISGSVLRDTNGNGGVDAGDLPLPGVLVQLQNQFGGLLAQTVTDANGAYAFANLAAGTYRVVEIDPANHVSVAAFSPTGVVINPNTIQLAVAGGLFGNNNFLDRAQVQTSTISGSVILDQNGNGIIDANDQPAPGVIVQLQNQFGGFLAQTVTDANGAYAFPNLNPGTYRVVENDPANVISLAAFSPTGVVINANAIQLAVAGGVFGNNNFLDRAQVVQPTVGTISGSVLRDANSSGVIDAGDQPAPGVTVRLFTALGAFIAQTVTDGNGAYAFPNLPPGTYLVQELDPAGVASVAAFPGPGGVVLNANTIQVNLGLGQASGNNNFLDAVQGPAPGTNTISGFAIRDANLNGVPDNEQGLPGMTITLRNIFGNVVASTVTNGTGAFAFTGLASGTYSLTATPPAGLISTNAIAGQGGTRLSATQISVTTQPGVTNHPGHLFLAGP